MRKHTLEAVFSLLPQEHINSAMRHIVERAYAFVSLDAFEIRWAELELDGTFLRGGISDISDLSSQIVTNSQRDQGIDLIVRRAARGDLCAGMLEWVPEHGLFLWYLPYRRCDENGKPGTRLRGLLVTEPVFGETLELFNSMGFLTVAEKRTIFQLVGGLELREAALIDDVSYETKRAHTKTACEKLGCSGQKDLVRKTMGQLFHLMSVGDSELRQSETASFFTNAYLGEDMRLIVRHRARGGVLRYLVGGPSDGTPIVFVHGMMFPVILRGVSQFLERHKLRLFVPIRAGYLESRALATLFSETDLLDLGLEEICAVIREENLGRVTLVGNSLGAIVAMTLARKRPELFSGLVLQSANLARPGHKTAGGSADFYSGMHELKSDEFLFRLANLEYRKFYSNAETCRHILKTHFAENQLDIEVLEGRYCGAPAYEMFAATYTSSIVGIAEDFRFVMSKRQQSQQPQQIPVCAIQGDQDPLTSIDELKNWLAGSDSRDFVTIPDAGHFAAASHGSEVWGATADFAGRTAEGEE